MRGMPRCCVLFLSLWIVAAPASAMEPFREPEVFYQVSTLEALMAGFYDGLMTFHELALHGDTGLGTFENLDGEMVALGGTFYQVRADGSVHVADLDMATPFAQVTPFEADITAELGQASDMAALTALINEHLAGENQFYAIILTGTFAHVKTRSVPAQQRPFPPLTEVVKHQSVFEFTDVQGTIVGIYSPDYVGPMGVPGYHLHFLTADRSGGGHLLDASMVQGSLQLDATPQFFLTVPGAGEFQERDFSVSQEDVHNVEH